jgi:hypothetical protein
MDNINSGAEPTQRDYQGQIMSALMGFFRARNVEDFSILMSPDNENSVLLNAVMQRERPVLNVEVFDDERDIEIEDHNDGVTMVPMPEGTLVIEYGKSETENKNSTVYVWVDDGGEVNYGTKTGK